MSEPFLGEIRMMSFGHAPKGWALCDGQLLPINQNQALFSLLGTMYGGDGRVNFALPDLRNRLPIHVGPDFYLAQKGGEVVHTLMARELPPHTHPLTASDGPGTATSPAGARWAATTVSHYGPASQVAMHAAAVGPSGGNQSHENRGPYLVISFAIALAGIFPSQN